MNPQLSISSFFNSTNEVGETLKVYQHKADSQDHLILQFLKHHRFSSFTPSEVNKRFAFKNWPITSVRRTLTYYTVGYKGREKLLIMTDEKREGPFRRDENCWQYKPNQS